MTVKIYIGIAAVSVACVISAVSADASGDPAPHSPIGVPTGLAPAGSSTANSTQAAAVRLGTLAAPAAFAPASAQYAQATTTGGVTDVGDVSTGGGQAAVPVTPDPTGTMAQALAAKKAAPNLVEIRPQSEIRKLPDVNVAEALERISGVSLQADTGEGRFINIRGLDADFNSVSYGGVRLLPSNIASPLGGGRAIALDSIPTNLVGAIEVVKSNRPDQDAESLGAAIELVPRTLPADGKPFLEVTGFGGVEPLRGTPRVGGSVAFGGTFGLQNGTYPWQKPGEVAPGAGWVSNPRPFGVLGEASFDHDQRGVDDIEGSYADMQSAGVPDKVFNTLELRRYLYDRRRFSQGGEFNFTPNDSNKFYVRVAEAGYNEHVSRQDLILSNLATGDGNGNYSDGSGGFLAPQATAQNTLRNESETIQTDVVSAGGTSVIDNRFRVSYRGSYSAGQDNRPYDYNSTFGNPNSINVDYNNQNSAHPAVRVLDGTNLANPNNYLFQGINNASEKDFDRERSAAIDVTAPFHIFGLSGDLKAGGELRLRDRSVDRVVRTYTPTDLGSTLNLANFVNGPSLVYYDNRYNIGPQPIGGINGVIGNPALVTQNLQADAISSAQAFQRNVENVYAQYFQYNARLGGLHLLAGMRFEETQGNYRANAVTTQLDGTRTISPVTNRQGYFNYFPTVQASYAVTPTLLARASYSTAIGRPGFNQITAATTVDIGNNTVTTGNPNLKPTTADSFDVALEQTLPNGGIASIQGFDKEFQNYVLGSQVIGSYPGIIGLTKIQTFANAASGARAYGMELGYIQKFVGLPYPLNGFGVDANYTLVQSRVELRPGEFKSLPSTSNHNANFAVFYEQGPVTLRLAAAYVSKNLFAVGANRSTDIFSQPRFRLDLQGEYQLAKEVAVFIAAKNLTDTPLIFTESGSSTRPIQREFYGPTIFAGLRSTF